jgi:hypothetical protein
LEK